MVDAARFVDPVSVRGASLSPGGNYIAYIRRTEQGEQIVVVDIATMQFRPIQAIEENQGGYDWVVWKGDNRLVAGIRIQQQARGRAGTGTRMRGDDVTYDVNRVVAFNRDGGEVVQMFEGQLRQLLYGYGSVFFLDPLSSDPNHVLVAAWDNAGTGAWRANVTTGHVERIANGSDYTWFYTTDGTGVPVMCVDLLPDWSGYKIYRRANGETRWTFVLDARRAEAATNSPDFEVVGPGPGPNQVYIVARREDSDLSALYLYDTATGAFGAPLQQPTQADAGDPWLNETTRELFATCEFAQRLSCRARDPAMQRHLGGINAFFERAANVTLVNMSANGARWLLHVDGPRDPGDYYLYEPATASLEPIARAYPSIDLDGLSSTETVSYAGSDGTQLWGYVTHRPSAGLAPMVVLPHGGPESRDYYGYEAYAQFLASRGYVVFQPNFRGSLGFGRAFADAGRRQWGRRMQDDITEGVRHLIAAGGIDPARICIVGASYGGYAALAGAALTPELYRCAISIAGVSDLQVALRTERGEGGSSMNYQYWLRSIGDPASMREQLIATSPRQQAARITAPVLLMHGEVDETVPILQSELMERALDAAGKPTRLIRFEGENHYWNQWSRENRLTLFRETEAFLAQHLGPAN